MNILKTQNNSTLKQAFSAGLQFTGHRKNGELKMDIENGNPVWLGDDVQWANFNDSK